MATMTANGGARRKRLSVAPTPAALSDVSALVLNDDESEKARLRAEKGRAHEQADGMPAGALSKRKSFGPVSAKLALAANAAAPAAPIPVQPPRKPMQAAEWKETMKMASSGKFCSKNIALVWGNDLISQMRDLLLGPAARQASVASSAAFLFDADADAGDSADGSSSQFQKASCTLDASMMIYSSRVDDVHKSTFRVLGGLSSSAVSALVRDDDDDDEEEGAHAEGDEVPLLDENGLPVVSKKKKGRKVGGAGGSATLESQPHKLDARLIETEVEVDPLFHLTTAKFEGGAGGMLMNNLSVHSGARLQLDSSDIHVLESVLAPKPAEGQTADAFQAHMARAETALRLNMDFAELAATLAAGVARAGAASIEELRLAPTVDVLLAEKAKLMGEKIEAPVIPAGRKGKAAQAAAEAAAAAAAAAAAIPVEFDFAAVSLPEPVASPMDDASPADCAAPEPLAVLSSQMASVVAALEQERVLEAQLDDGGYGGGGADAYDDDDGDDGARSHATASSGSSATTAVASNAAAAADDDASDAFGVLEGLGETATNWCGIKHWKFKAKPSAAQTTNAGAKKKRATKGTKDIMDFSTVPLGAPGPAIAASAASLRLPDQLSHAGERKAREAALRLPDDRFYRVRNLQTLCQKPGVLVKLRSSAPRRAIPSCIPSMADAAAAGCLSPQRAVEPIPSSHCAAAAVEFVCATPAASALLDGAGVSGGGVGNSPSAVASGSSDAQLGQLQFDDGDDGHENEAYSGGNGGADMMDDDDGDVCPETGVSMAPESLSLAAPLRAERIQIGYARVSKKVDVKALKAAMWTTLQAQQARVASPSAAASPSAPTFSSAISGVRAVARGDLSTQLPVITPSYYFISLLHLCNEHGLALDDPPERQALFGDFKIVQQ